MKILVTGAGGFLGTRLVRALLERPGRLADALGSVECVIAGDIRAPALPADARLHPTTLDITDRRQIAEAAAEVDLVFHLAAIVSGDAERDFDRGMRVNLDGTRMLLEMLRQSGRRPRLVFASSVAVYGGAVEEPITDQTHLTPQTSYGCQKASSELLVQDYSRKGFIDGRSLRLPTIVVRAGSPNLAASTFASSIIREPLAGRPAVCPVDPATRMYILSPRRVIEAFLHAACLPEEVWGCWRSLLLPGLTVSVEEMLACLERVAGEQVVRRVRFEADPAVRAIVAGWPAEFAPRRALEMGFRADRDFTEIIEAHIEDELGGRIG